MVNGRYFGWIGRICLVGYSPFGMAALEFFDFQAGLPGQLVSFASDLEIRLAIEQDVEPGNKQDCHYWYAGPNDRCSAND